MVRLTVFTGGGVRMYATETYKTLHEYYLDLNLVADGKTKCILFKDIYETLVSISPINCVIEAKEIKENDDAS